MCVLTGEVLQIYTFIPGQFHVFEVIYSPCGRLYLKQLYINHFVVQVTQVTIIKDICLSSYQFAKTETTTLLK